MSISPWLDDVLAGVFILRHVDDARARAIIRTASASLRAPDFGGFDYMAPNTQAEAWLLLGR